MGYIFNVNKALMGCIIVHGKNNEKTNKNNNNNCISFINR